MPRGVKKTAAYQIAEIDAKIGKKQQEIIALQAQRKELESSQQVEIAIKIVKVATEKGISVEEILDLIEK